MRGRRLRVFLMYTLAVAPACARHLPEQDLRILTAAPSAKLSTDDLWKDFQKDPAAARRQYFGRAVDVSGRIGSIEPDLTKKPHIFFGQAGEHGLRAQLLDDRAAETLKPAAIGARITLRCFCEGLNDQQDLLLKSCIRP